MHFPKINIFKYKYIFQILDEEEEEREIGDEEEEEREMGVKNEALEEVDVVPSRSVSVAGAVKRFIASLTSRARVIGSINSYIDTKKHQEITLLTLMKFILYMYIHIYYP